jgi:site-specific DNA-adenine methylase
MTTPIRFAYADPPYIGQSKRLYGDHPDYAGEVDHAELIDRLMAEFPDGWALSLSMKSLPQIMRLCPPDVLTLA